MNTITPCLWFDREAEEAARFYVSVFPDSAIHRVSRYGEEGCDVHGQPAGSVMTVDFELRSRPFIALNGGPHFRFSEAISFQVACDTQDEIDYYWDRLGEAGSVQQCGWLKDRFGLSWQVVPSILPDLMTTAGPEAAERVMRVMLQMRKLDVGQLQAAASA